jgi:murein DD-endopeptidase MepM/ murein hydrolase activator NlpD
MISLPAISGKTQKRPGRHRKSKTEVSIPNEETHSEFWKEFYGQLDASGLFHFPIENAEEKINPYFGYFGLEWHPVSYKPGYFNIGVDFSGDPKTPIKPIANGILEYSGYGIINGNYVVLSHPEVVTEDGYMLQSMYMHNRANVVSFSSYQKMLRQISLNSYPEIPVSAETIIAEMGDTGNAEGFLVHVHIQTILTHKKNPSVAIDPARVLGIKPKKNRTASIKTHKDFIQKYRKYKKNITEWGLEKFWTSRFRNI